MVQIKITAKAKKDIINIYSYILQDSYQNAETVAKLIIKKIDTLKKQSEIGKIVREFNNPNIRELKLFKYRIIYRLNSSFVEVITIQHSTRLLNNNPHLKDFFD